MTRCDTANENGRIGSNTLLFVFVVAVVPAQLSERGCGCWPAGAMVISLDIFHNEAPARDKDTRCRQRDNSFPCWPRNITECVPVPGK